MAVVINAKGTSVQQFQIGKQGPLVKNVSGNINFKDSTDTSLAGITIDSALIGEASGGDQGSGTVNASTYFKDGVTLTATAITKNALINGNFDIWQRGTSFTSSAEYSADRWIHNFAGGTGTITRQSFTVGATIVLNEPEFYLRFVKTGAGTGPNIDQRIENLRTFASETVTLSFWARVASGTESVTSQLLNNFGTGGSPSADTSQAGSAKTITTTWTKFTQTFTVNSLSGKTLGTNNDHFLGVRFSLPSSTYTFELAQVQLEKGSDATEFERRLIVQELAMAQRYTYRQTKDSGGSFRAVAPCYAQSSTNARATIRFPVQMRTTPVFTLSAASHVNININLSNKVPSSVAQANASEYGASIDNTTTGLTASHAGQMQLSTANSWIQWDAEL